MKDTFTLLAQTAEKASGELSPLQSFLGSPLPMILGMFLLMYFLIIRPQQKQKKDLEQRVAALKKGDKVVTNGGIHGVVNHKGDTTVSLKVSEGVFITMESANIATITPVGSGKADDSSES